MANINQCDQCKHRISGLPRYTLGERVDDTLTVLDFCTSECRARYVVLNYHPLWPMAFIADVQHLDALAHRDALKSLLLLGDK